MAAITKQLTALSSLHSAARFVQLYTVDTRVPPMSNAAEVEGEVRPYYQVKKDEQEMILKVNLPGVDNEGTKVWVEDHGALCFKATGRDFNELFIKDNEGKFLCDTHLYLLDEQWFFFFHAKTFPFDESSLLLGGVDGFNHPPSDNEATLFSNMCMISKENFRAILVGLCINTLNKIRN